MTKSRTIIIRCKCRKIEMPMEEFKKKVADWMKPFGPDFTMMPNVNWQCMKCFDVCTLEVVDETNNT